MVLLQCDISYWRWIHCNIVHWRPYEWGTMSSCFLFLTTSDTFYSMCTTEFQNYECFHRDTVQECFFNCYLYIFFASLPSQWQKASYYSFKSGHCPAINAFSVNISTFHTMKNRFINKIHHCRVSFVCDSWQESISITILYFLSFLLRL